MGEILIDGSFLKCLFFEDVIKVEADLKPEGSGSVVLLFSAANIAAN